MIGMCFTVLLMVQEWNVWSCFLPWVLFAIFLSNKFYLSKWFHFTKLVGHLTYASLVVGTFFNYWCIHITTWCMNLDEIEGIDFLYNPVMTFIDGQLTGGILVVLQPPVIGTWARDYCSMNFECSAETSECC